MDALFVYDEQLSFYELSTAHPFKPIRLELTKTLLEALGLLQSSHIIKADAILDSQLLLVHDSNYVQAVQILSDGMSMDTIDSRSIGLGTADNPIFFDMHMLTKDVVAGTVTAVDKVASGQVKRAVNLAGGLHHAHRARASGFCIYNDLSVGIEHAIQKYNLRVAYIDLDAHHGDGVQWQFYKRPDVLTLSVHQSGQTLFPWTGAVDERGEDAGMGHSINIPLQPFTTDESYLEIINAVIPDALDAFKPDIIILQAGADMHYLDPLADLHISTQAQYKSYKLMSDLADEFTQGRIVATGGGGYDAHFTVPRTWASLWAALTKQDMPLKLPASWQAYWREKGLTTASQFEDDVTQWANYKPSRMRQLENLAVARAAKNTLDF